VLHHLLEYAESRDLKVDPAFSKKKVTWIIACDKNGKFTGVVSLDKKEYLCPAMTTAELTKGGKTRSHFLVTTLDQLALYKVDEEKREKVEKKHLYYCDTLDDASVDAPYLAEAAKMLRDPKQIKAICDDLAQTKAKPTDKAVVRVGKKNPLERDDWKNWWLKQKAALSPPVSSCNMIDVLTGEKVIPVKSHAAKISGLSSVGGLGTGDTLVSFDKSAFQSYDLEGSLNAAMSQETVNTYTAALNDLLANNSERVGGVKLIYWFKESVSEEEDVLSWLTDPPEREGVDARAHMQDMLVSVKEGKRPDLKGNRYYMFTLSGASGRVMVRRWVEGSYEVLVGNVNKWFDDFSITSPDGMRVKSTFRLYAILRSLVRTDKQFPKLPPSIANKLWCAAIEDQPISYRVLSLALERIRSCTARGDDVPAALMGLLKAYLIRKGEDELESTINVNHSSPAYHCGRLLAILSRLQYAALGNVGANVTKKFYKLASRMPSMAIGRILANAKNHLNKLDGGLENWYEALITDVVVKIGDTIPKTLTQEGQSLFGLGYYQQIAEMRRKKGETDDQE